MSVLDPFGPFSQLLPTEEAAVAHFTAKRWRHGGYCPYCDCRKLYQWATRDRHSCSGCGRTFSIKTGTLFHNSRRPMRHWLAVIWLATEAERGLTIRKVSGELHISAAAAWSMLTRLQSAIRTPSFLGAKATAERDHPAVQIVDAPIAGRHYERKLKIGMPFEAAVDRFADVSRREIETVKANSPRLKRVQRTGWRRKVSLVDGELVDPDDDPEIVLSREVLVDDEAGSVMNSPG